jgi:hypothetical protein
MQEVPVATRDYIVSLETAGFISPDCRSCLQDFYPELVKGKKLGDIFAPRHQASKRCESGKRAHCTCDTCF